MNPKKEDKMEIRISNKAADAMEMSKYFAKYEPESNVGVFFKDIIHGFLVGNVILIVGYEGKVFKGGVVLTLISKDILFINFSYIDQHTKNLSKKFFLFIMEMAKKLNIKDIQAKAERHFEGAEKKFGFTDRYKVIGVKIEEIKKTEPPKEIN